MAKIENPKSYTGRDLETIFFRPMLTGPDAASLGIKIMYNMPVPTTLQFWKRAGDILQKYTASGWNGGSAATKYQKSIQLSKVKAEVGYSADDYFNMVYELITNRSDVNLDDLSGTELEAAESALFKEAIERRKHPRNEVARRHVPQRHTQHFRRFPQTSDRRYRIDRHRHQKHNDSRLFYG